MQRKEAMQHNDNLALRAAAAAEAFVEHNPTSAQWHERAARAMPGGNTRTVLHYDPFPLRLVAGHGALLEDADGHRYADYLGEYSAGLYGHRHPLLQAAAMEAIAEGLTRGGPNPQEVELSELVVARFPAIEAVRFTNSGTEANLLAIGAARNFTGRDHVLGVAGGYHGGVLYFGDPKSPLNAPFPLVLGVYNDLEATIAAARGKEDRIAAIIVEPMMGSGGGIVADRAYLAGLQAFAERIGALLILDEVMTSRMGPGGLHGELGLTPDLVTLGKYLGGGFSFGAFGGRADVMRPFDPFGANPLRHAGTFNNNVASMAAGLTGLRDVFTPEVARRLMADGEDLRARLNGIARARGLPAQFTGVGSIMCVHFHDRVIRSPADASEGHPDVRRLFHLEMLARGQYMARRGFMSLSLALEPEHHDAFARAVDEVLAQHGDVLFDG